VSDTPTIGPSTSSAGFVGLVHLIRQSAQFEALAATIRAQTLQRALGLPRAARPLVVAALQQALSKPILYVTSSVDSSRTMTNALNDLLGEGTATRFTEPNTAFYDTVPPVREVIAQRSQVLAILTSPPSPLSLRRGGVVISSPRALMHPTLSAEQFKRDTRTLKRDVDLQLEQMVAHWVSVGYESEQVVERVGAFSRRGGIVDVWSPAHALPVRIELFGNTIDSLRFFDPGTQRSGAQVDEIRVTPLEAMSREPRAMSDDSSQLKAHGSLLGYLSDALLVIDDEDELSEAWRGLEEKAERERESVARTTGSNAEDVDTSDDEAAGLIFLDENDVTETSKPYLRWDQFSEQMRGQYAITLGQDLDDAALTQHPFAAQFSPAPHFAGQLSPLMEYLHGAVSREPTALRLGEKATSDEGSSLTAHGSSLTAHGSSLIIISRQSARLAEVWSEKHSPIASQSSLAELPQGSPSGALHFVVGALPEGFTLAFEGLKVGAESPTFKPSNLQTCIVLTDAEIFGYVKPESFMRGKARKSAPERAFADWKIGDAVVHEDYGIGIFRGLMKLTVNTGTSVEPVEGEREYLLLEYKDADRLYVPLHQLDRVSRFIGGDDARPELDKLGSGGWVTTKQKAKGAAADTAREMLKLYATRELAPGYSFSKDTAWQYELESSFPYVETEDQLTTIGAVKADMERSTPMDRLVVGDVGFGKTEVALRAAFKAVQDSKQVAVLVPTTILAQQHFNTFERRMGAYPITIEMLSRFRTAKEKREVLEGLREGKVDIVIGTHGLVAESVKFKDLGLLIIDEEQRFGLKAKERLKKLRAEVDVLTLTATPIPRTLYMGLSGIRDISKIETPPAERLPIISFVGQWDDVVVQQAIRRELDRSGQIFFVHNRINSIELVAQKLRRLIPDAVMAVAHGQMDERELARIMTRFADEQIDILLSTNIIESGLDIPNANTIIVDNADHFGLAELHQLRGRVGRSTVQAYAYFFHDRRSRMTEEARERLETLREVSGIGAGYAIAMRDLELRGSGDLLGPKQSGQISAVGFDLYTRLLSREVSTLRAMRDGTPLPEAEKKAVVLDLPLSVGLPESYIREDTLRIQLYRRVASLENEEQIRAFEDELDDRFGKLPQPAKNLTYQVRLKLAATELGAQSITTDGNRFTIRAPALEQMNRTRLERLLGEDCVIGRTQVVYSRSGTPEQWKAKLMEIVRRLAAMKI
jgi:transcription-repair coupling factor (superfamily II helicase)